MFVPSLKEFKQKCQQGNLVPVYMELPADVETPVSAFLKIADKAQSAFLFESVEGGERLGRYSFLGASPTERVTVRGGVMEHRQEEKTRLSSHGGNPMGELRNLMRRYRPVSLPELPPFHGGLVGYISYDMVRYFEKLPHLNPDDLGLPEAMFFFTENLLVFDHVKHVIKIVSNAHVTGKPKQAYERAVHAIRRLAQQLQRPLPAASRKVQDQPLTFQSNVTRKNFMDNVRRAKEYIRAGDIIQVQVSQRLTTISPADPFDVYRALRAINPSPYMFYLRFPECHLIGSSPELLVRKDGPRLSTRPIAGTMRRGHSALEDRVLEERLLADPKERAEHIMLVDLGRNDLGRVSRAGTVRVPELMVIERYSHVMHIVSHVEGKISPGYDAFDVLQAAFPAGTVTGAPKIRSMEIIEELEKCRRGPYAGAVGYFDYSGNMDTGITIRTILYTGGKYHLQAAAGIVADSKPAREYQETINKMQATVK
ncbi:anthranilate synthase component I, partial [candidate division FCPU426 bacterium]|nr:anthranilate synthase component I [candidate division FCPU426 bacterium]